MHRTTFMDRRIQSIVEAEREAKARALEREGARACCRCRHARGRTRQIFWCGVEPERWEAVEPDHVCARFEARGGGTGDGG